MFQPERTITCYQKPPIPHAMTLHGDTLSIITTGCGTIRSPAESPDYLQQEIVTVIGDGLATSLQDRILKEIIIDRIPQREVSRALHQNGYRYRHIYEPVREYAIYQRQSAFSEERDEWKHCSTPPSARLIVSFYSMGGIRLRQITPLWHWQKISSRRQYGIRFVI